MYGSVSERMKSGVYIVDLYLFRYGDTAMQSKSMFPARIAPFSVILGGGGGGGGGRMEAVQGLRKARFEREKWTFFALLYEFISIKEEV